MAVVTIISSLRVTLNCKEHHNDCYDKKFLFHNNLFLIFSLRLGYHFFVNLSSFFSGLF